MLRLPISAILVLLLLASIAVAAQQTTAARICVYGTETRFANTLAGQVNYSPQARYQRDLVVKYLNQVKAPSDARLKLEATALTTQNRDEVLAEADTKGCLYLLSVSLSGVGWPSSSASDQSDQQVYEKYGASVDPRVTSETTPLTFVVMYHKSPHLWVSYPYGSYSQYKWFAQVVAEVAYATILKNPAP